MSAVFWRRGVYSDTNCRNTIALKWKCSGILADEGFRLLYIQTALKSVHYSDYTTFTKKLKKADFFGILGQGRDRYGWYTMC